MIILCQAVVSARKIVERACKRIQAMVRGWIIQSACRTLQSVEPLPETVKGLIKGLSVKRQLAQHGGSNPSRHISAPFVIWIVGLCGHQWWIMRRGVLFEAGIAPAHWSIVPPTDMGVF